MKEIERIEEGILSTLKEIIFPDQMFEGKKINFHKGYLPIDDYETRIKEGKKEKDRFPAIIIRPGKMVQGNTIITGYEKTQEFIIRILLEEAELTGYHKIIDIAEKIISHFSDFYIEPGKYNIDLTEKITGNINEDATAGDYWGYDISFYTRLCVNEQGSILQKNGW